MPTGITDFSRHGFCLQNLANLVTFTERNFPKKQEFEQNMYLFFNYASEDFFSEFYYPNEIVTENEGNLEVLSILCALPIWSHNKQLNSLVCSGFTVKLVWTEIFDLLTSPRGSVHKAKISSLSLELHSKALARGTLLSN